MKILKFQTCKLILEIFKWKAEVQYRNVLRNILTVIRLLLDKSRNVKQWRLWNNFGGIFFNLFLNRSKVSRERRFLKALSVMLLILFSDSFNTCNFFKGKVPFSIRNILFFDRSNVRMESKPIKVSDGIYTIWLLDISKVSRKELLLKRRSGNVCNKLLDKSTWKSFFAQRNVSLSISSR